MEGTIGEIRGFGGNFAPRNWAFCNGQLIAINQNQALFSIIGTIYGGDGRTTFALPDLRGRAPLSSGTGPGLSPRPLGQRSGTEIVTLTTNQMPSHNHYLTSSPGAVIGAATATMNVNNTTSSSSNPSGNYLGVEQGALGLYESTTDGSTLAAGAITVNMTGLGLDTSKIGITPTGGSQYHNNMQPYLVIHWVICLQGVFPSRS